MFPGFLGYSLAGQALSRGDWGFNTINIRNFATDKHKTVDDAPFGGGAGMVMRPDIVAAAFDSVPSLGYGIYLSPRGQPLTQKLAYELSQKQTLSLLCGRYEGVDQRVIDAYNLHEISLGDYVLSGGEVAALTLMDSIIRLLPNVLGNFETLTQESFGISSQNLLEYNHYTRPANWLDSKGHMRIIPDVLTSGHHEQVRQWREKQAESITQQRRPDLWQLYVQQHKPLKDKKN
jgi:tRNA (guanine37-N1)-methyltransferase